ncbi:hypothetical protein EAH89_17810 [Roseomonas nepalensis]|uniref:Quinol:cytochrome c oxidoreductase quinone-binding subunit 2 n=1 Tax=Muricoccus nepalensis TaxID=1854500 RepID=A0A502FUD3_9PROT|nr:hypothetical protein [Roseomonas nepalensis]TPG53168.1 hypothetical protein EAH89_17810 [Roseomonas nepalensis]
MSGARSGPRARRPGELAGPATRLGLAAAAALLAWALLARPMDWPAGVPAAGWLVGLVFWLAVSLGAVALIAIQALTGGRWGEALHPALRPASLLLPAFLPLAVPLFLALPTLYPWAADPGAAVHADVARLYLNPHGFVLRAFLALGGWSLLALLLGLLRPGGLRRLVAALGLVFHLAATTVLSLDWLLSLDPRFQSTAFGMAAVATQILLALAWAAALRPEPGEAGDLAAMLLAASLGVLYLGFAQYLVAWYGDLPPKAEWFLRRQGWGWTALEAASVTLSALLPIGALLLARVRRRPAALARLGPAVMLGVLAHLVWIVAPAFGAAAVPAALLGVVAVGGLWVGLVDGPLAARLRPRQEVAHGA